ncbi:MAG: hypothetical protein WBE38_17460 [Terracidiphilus sp.]
MKTYIMFGISLLLSAGTASAQCSGAPKYRAQLQWSESAKVVSPDHAWVVEVRAVFDADENRTPVTVHRCGGIGSWPLFTLKRDAELHWGADSNHILVINEPLSGTNELLFFSVASLTTGTQGLPPDALDRAVNEALTERLGKEKYVQYYLPSLVSWKGNDLLLAVGGETNLGHDGPLASYCYGMRINISTLHVESVLSEKELKTRTGHGCQDSP